jgi:hypothetical protein
VIPVPLHRWKDPGLLGATDPRERGPFGPWPEPEEDETTAVPYFRGTPTLFCQRQNTGRTGLDDHYSPLA